MRVLGAAEAQAAGLSRKGQAGPVSGGAMVLGTFSTLWVQVYVLVGSRVLETTHSSSRLWELRSSADLKRVLQVIKVEPATLASSGNKDPSEAKPDFTVFWALSGEAP